MFDSAFGSVTLWLPPRRLIVLFPVFFLKTKPHYVCNVNTNITHTVKGL